MKIAVVGSSNTDMILKVPRIPKPGETILGGTFATAAGDVFNGSLSVVLAEGKPLQKAVRFANAAAALSVTKLGAQPSAPGRKEIQAVLDQN